MRLVLLIVAIVATLFVVAGCGGETVSPAPDTVEGTIPTETETTSTTGGEGEGDPEAGKDIFAAQGCGSCHTLADAGSNGTVGPDLDELSPDFETVKTTVTNGKGTMPAFGSQLDEQEINNVAAYVVQATSG